MRAILAAIVLVVGPAGLLAPLVALCACEREPPLKLGITPQQHATFFPIAGKVPHALGAISQNGTAIDCDACHAAADDFAVPLCLQCHAQDSVNLDRAHSGIAGYVAQDDQCYACHRDGNRGPELDVNTHAVLFPINFTDIHGNDAFRARARISAKTDLCLACHTSNVDRSTNSCFACHKSDPEPLTAGHASLPRAFSTDDEQCKACHSDIPIPTAVHPLTNHNAGPPFYDPNHHDAVCGDCHQQKRVDARTFGTDFSSFTCSNCHVHQHSSDCSPTNTAPCH